MIEDLCKKYALFVWLPLRRSKERFVDPVLLASGDVFQLSKNGLLWNTRYNHFSSVDHTSTNVLLQIGNIGGRMRPMVIDDRIKEPTPGTYAAPALPNRAILSIHAQNVQRASLRDYVRFLLGQDNLGLGVLQYARVHGLPEYRRGHFLAGIESLLEKYELYEAFFPDSNLRDFKKY